MELEPMHAESDTEEAPRGLVDLLLRYFSLAMFVFLFIAVLTSPVFRSEEEREGSRFLDEDPPATDANLADPFLLAPVLLDAQLANDNPLIMLSFIVLVAWLWYRPRGGVRPRRTTNEDVETIDLS